MNSKMKDLTTDEKDSNASTARASLALRLPLDRLATLEKLVKNPGRYFSTKELVESTGISEPSVSAIRHIFTRNRELAEAIFRDRISLHRAKDLLKSGNCTELPTTATRLDHDITSANQ